MSVLLRAACPLLLFTSLSAQALDLGDAYALALRNDPTWQGSIAEREAGLENLAIGRAGLLPRLSYRYNRARNDSEVTQRSQFGDVTTQRDYRSYSSTLTLEQPLFDYAAWSDYRRGVAQAALADERYRGRGQELMVRLFGAYSEALFANEQIALAQAQRRTYAEQLTLNERLLKGGEGTRTDVLETRARYELAQAQEIEAGDNLDAALHALQAIIGEPVAVEDLAPMTADFRVQPLTPTRFERWRDLAVAHNAELASQRHGLEVAEQNIERQRAGHLPSLSAYASKGISSSSSESSYNQRYDTDSIGVQLSVPLYAGGGVQASVRQARAQRDAVGFELDAQLNDTLTQLRRQFNLCASGTAKIRAYDLAVKAASALVQATRKSVRGGERVNLDVLDAEQQLFSARRDLAQARHEYLRAWLQLRYLAGVLEAGDLNALSRYFLSHG
ncbi:TolC family outer membrane protein [Pseudomonas mosselii]|uniref:TolC family outer membrane protein n=1 Tax=Pseudomonas mosselii TaxID=78327 RepID=UPI0007705901|nr:TolC family outer membrane protein [Pseudomonas mosselii]AMK32976.1 ABC exporter for hemopore HasA outer membrane component HasF [Pseudomonas putida]MBC3453625.1 TolC family outer membrane protein [Pseudomonas mosselii]MDH1656939.1 TolC family outer membrane protein [Pseudomonas mosselii]MDH1719463.1 TolC family outer membrane protein [Pseudomonas mosselii]MDH1723380.1 TolC family outer membrane protein [Pseudomonas mosselii]